MSKGQIDFQDVLELVELVKSSSNFNEVRLRTGNLEVELRRKSGSPLTTVSTNRSVPAAPSALPVGGDLDDKETESFKPASTEVSPASLRQGSVVVRSPMVGTVYHAPEPGAAPFVTVGQSVSPGDQICIVEVMKLMSAIKAECHGVVTEILVADAELVEHGQELFVISDR
ncbi:MAG: acetyl-CoA carboxylase biotin carboxyl carrier protein [Sulfuritalea sp.]|nr:acetyl-CoA carboxylase biotin carboxyl carrier protein [Sulfuritalea sp.]